jgi:DNA-3-methyladenine glycosylase II
MYRRAINHLKRVDPALRRVIDLVGPCHFQALTDGTHFDAVVRSIVYQQLSGQAAATIHRRLREHFGGATPLPGQLLATSDDVLRAVGLSRQKIAYLRDLALKCESGDVPILKLHELDDASVIDALTKVKGVGVWTAQMFLIFRLSRPDVLPDLDLGIRKAIQRVYGLRKMPTSERVQTIGARWSPHCTIASWYLWRSLEHEATNGARAAKRSRARRARRTSRRGR